MEQSKNSALNPSIIKLLDEHNFWVHKFRAEKNGNRVFIKSEKGRVQECLVRRLDLDQTNSLKTLKSDFDYKITANRWIIVELVMEKVNPLFFMVPLTVFNSPTNWFIDNEQPSKLHNHMSNWEIKIYQKALPEMSGYLMEKSLKNLV